MRLSLIYSFLIAKTRTERTAPEQAPSVPPMKAVPLSDIAPATFARVTRLHVYADDATRLKAMGICVGRPVQLVRTGDPLILRVLGARIGLSARVAAVALNMIDLANKHGLQFDLDELEARLD